MLDKIAIGLVIISNLLINTLIGSLFPTGSQPAKEPLERPQVEIPELKWTDTYEYRIGYAIHQEALYQAKLAAEEAARQAEAEKARLAAIEAQKLASAPQITPVASNGLNWAALRQCESGGDYANKKNPKYRGAYQFSYATWQTVGGTGDPADASPAEQDMRAQMLYDRAGPGQWPVCGKLL